MHITYEDSKKIENELIKEFTDVFYEKLGYYPRVITKAKINIKNSIDLSELEKYFQPFIDTLVGKGIALSSKNKTRRLSELRFMFFHIAKKYKYTLTEIGQFCGKRDHTTIIHGLKMFQILFKADCIFNKTYSEILNKIKENYELSTMENSNQVENKSESALFSKLL